MRFQYLLMLACMELDEGSGKKIRPLAPLHRNAELGRL